MFFYYKLFYRLRSGVMKGYAKSKLGVNLFQWIVNGCTIIAFILQFIPLPYSDCFMPIVAIGVIVLIIISIFISAFSYKNSKIKRKKLIKQTEEILRNSTDNIVLLGGDLSWTDDYLNEIRELINNSQKVEIIFPNEKIKNIKGSVLNRFNKRVENLKKVGATVYCSDINYEFRYTLIDVNFNRNNENLKVISSKRAYKHKEDINKNKYEALLLSHKNDNDKMLCDLYYQNYLLIKEHCSEY